MYEPMRCSYAKPCSLKCIPFAYYKELTFQIYNIGLPVSSYVVLLSRVTEVFIPRYYQTGEVARVSSNGDTVCYLRMSTNVNKAYRNPKENRGQTITNANIRSHTLTYAHIR